MYKMFKYRTCSRCGIVGGMFWTYRRNGVVVRTFWCKACAQDWRRAYYHEHKDANRKKHNAFKERWRKNNLKHAAKYLRMYRAKRSRAKTEWGKEYSSYTRRDD